MNALDETAAITLAKANATSFREHIETLGIKDESKTAVCLRLCSEKSTRGTLFECCYMAEPHPNIDRIEVYDDSPGFIGDLVLAVRTVMECAATHVDRSAFQKLADDTANTPLESCIVHRIIWHMSKPFVYSQVFLLRYDMLHHIALCCLGRPILDEQPLDRVDFVTAVYGCTLL